MISWVEGIPAWLAAQVTVESALWVAVAAFIGMTVFAFSLSLKLDLSRAKERLARRILDRVMAERWEEESGDPTVEWPMPFNVGPITYAVPSTDTLAQWADGSIRYREGDGRGAR